MGGWGEGWSTRARGSPSDDENQCRVCSPSLEKCINGAAINASCYREERTLSEWQECIGFGV